MSAYYIVIYTILGLVIGSFLNVVIYRVPRDESIATPRSHCPECNHYLGPWELIPVLSYIILGGKCAKCQSKISLRYPGVEILTGVLFAVTYFFRPDRTLTGVLLDLLFVALLIALTFIDIDTFRLPDILVTLVALTGLANTLITGEPSLKSGLIGSLVFGTLFILIYYFYPEGMGLGDVKFVAALGLYTGFPGIFAVVFIASILGVIIGGLQVIRYKKKLKEPIPFGPFLAAGAVIVLLFGDSSFNFWYF